MRAYGCFEVEHELLDLALGVAVYADGFAAFEVLEYLGQ